VGIPSRVPDGFVQVRPLGNIGRYPSFAVNTDRHILHADEEFAWSAVIQPRFDRGDGELSWLSPEEIRLYAAVTMSEKVPWEHGRIIFAPWTFPLGVPFDRRLFRHEEGMRILKKNARRAARRASRLDYFEVQRETRFTIVDSGSADDAMRLLDAIDPSDPLLIRGLSKYLSANHLIWYGPFMEEAGIAALIGLEAALELCRRDLSRAFGRDVPYVEVFEDLRTGEEGDAFVSYLQELYDARILMIHPNSRFGPFWTPPVQVDDCFSCLDVSMHLYRRMLLGEW
jgi:hypothetical protein